eukprot:1346758-Amorphochlora_amoeboformis.AAC.1
MTERASESDRARERERARDRKSARARERERTKERRERTHLPKSCQRERLKKNIVESSGDFWNVLSLWSHQRVFRLRFLLPRGVFPGRCEGKQPM